MPRSAWSLFRHHSVRRRMVMQLVCMVGACLAIGLAGMWGVGAMRQDLGLAIRGNLELRRLYEAGHRVLQAREAAENDDPGIARDELRGAMMNLSPHADEAEGWIEPAQERECRQKLQGLLTQLGTGSTNKTAAITAMNALLAKFAAMSAGISRAIQEQQRQAEAKYQMMMLLTALLAGLATVLAALFAVRQYRSITGPLRRLGEHARRLAGGHLEDRLELRDGEFASLASEYNRMAEELDRLYRDLDHRVQAAAAELMRSERLASIGYLAAGVAHEINNPLAVISGHGERIVRLAGRPLDEPAKERLRQAGQTISEEAFRCKAITERLLSLARPGREGMCAFGLRELVKEVIGDLTSLPRYAERRVTLAEGAPEGVIVANAGEMKQVVINLLVNALDATTGGDGRVEVMLREESGEVGMEVRDNGEGMTQEVIGRIFEPWFSRRENRPGTGLGLSLSHAIVKEHHGRLEAMSEGRGKGSCFTVWLPASRRGVA